MKAIKEMKEHYKASGYLFSLIIIILFLFYNRNLDYFGDAGGYFFMSTEFLNQGFGNFKMVFEEGSGSAFLFAVRGYGWPFMIAILRLLGFRTQLGWLFWWACFICFGLSYVIPELFETIFKRNNGFISRIIVCVFMLIFFPGIIIYPLSDIPAITMVCLGILLIIKSYTSVMVKKIFMVFGSGVCLGLAYYIRTGCIVSCIVAIALIIIYEKRMVKKLIVVLALLVGIAVSMIPQIIINRECNGLNTYKVPIGLTTNITQQEYYNGVRYFRFETNVTGKHPDLQLISEDNMASTLFKQQNMQPEAIGAKDLFKSMSKYPLEFLGIFASKFANFIDSRYGELYIHELKGMKYILIILNFSVWFLGGVGLFYELGVQRRMGRVKNKQISNIFYFIKNYFLYIFSCTAPAFVHILGTHVEPRYILPITVFVWQYLGNCSIKSILRFVYDNIISVSISFVVLLGCCSAIWNFTFENIPHFSYMYQKSPAVLENPIDKDRDIDTENIAAVTERFEFNEDKKIEIQGFAFIGEMNSKETQMKVAFVGDDKTYLYKINTMERRDISELYGQSYLNSGFIFSAYLWDLSPEKYKVYIVMENNGIEKVYDTLKEITLVAE